jgi:hypothetical protein
MAWKRLKSARMLCSSAFPFKAVATLVWIAFPVYTPGNTKAQGISPMKRYLFAAAIALGAMALMPSDAHAIECANGVYRAGCVGPNGAAVVKKAPPAAYVHPPRAAYAHPPASVTCAKGVYREGCAGPNGAAVVRR